MSNEQTSRGLILVAHCRPGPKCSKASKQGYPDAQTAGKALKADARGESYALASRGDSGRMLGSARDATETDGSKSDSILVKQEAGDLGKVALWWRCEGAGERDLMGPCWWPGTCG